MIVEQRGDDLIVLPETDFERGVIDHFRNPTAFVKCGLTPAEVIGIVIRKEQATVTVNVEGVKT